MRRAVLAGLFLISGFCELVYEIVWTRFFGLIFGNTTLASSPVLTAYMLGLAPGGLLLGRLADNLKSPLKIYALLEIGIAFPVADWSIYPGSVLLKKPGSNTRN